MAFLFNTIYISCDSWANQTQCEQSFIPFRSHFIPACMASTNPCNVICCEYCLILTTAAFNLLSGISTPAMTSLKIARGKRSDRVPPDWIIHGPFRAYPKYANRLFSSENCKETLVPQVRKTSTGFAGVICIQLVIFYLLSLYNLC